MLEFLPVDLLEEAGFQCPKLKYPLRNPLKIANYAQKVIQDRLKNGLDGLLHSEIDTSQDVNVTEGQLIIVNEVFDSWIDAIITGLTHIPPQKQAMVFFNNTGIRDPLLIDIKEAFKSRKEPIVFNGPIDEAVFKKWQCQPGGRENDLCIVGMDSKINGIETEIVVHVFPAECRLCHISSADPVIISRTKAMLIIVTYKRSIHKNCNWSSRKSSFNSNRSRDSLRRYESYIFYKNAK